MAVASRAFSMYRGDAEAFVRETNLFQQAGAAGVAINGYEIGADGNIARVTSRSRDGDGGDPPRPSLRAQRAPALGVVHHSRGRTWKTRTRARSIT